MTYLLLFGRLPDEQQLADFKKILASQRSLPTNFVRDVVMKAPSRDMMNTLSRSVLTLYAYDNNADDISLPNVLRQCLNLISVFPMLSVYGYQAYNHYIRGKSLYIHHPARNLSTAENILRMLRPDKKYSPLEATILIWLWCFMRSMEAEITPLLPLTWFLHRGRIRILPLPQLSVR